MTFEQIVKKNGFHFEEHEVHTKDGYYLTAFRIMNKEDKEKGIRRPVVFMQHGVTDYAFGWIMHYPEKSPAF